MILNYLSTKINKERSTNNICLSLHKIHVGYNQVLLFLKCLYISKKKLSKEKKKCSRLDVKNQNKQIKESNLV